MFLSFSGHESGLVEQFSDVEPIIDETELIYAIAMSIGIERYRAQRAEMALDVGLEGADPARLAAIASVLKSEQVKHMIDRVMPALAPLIHQIGEGALPVTRCSSDGGQVECSPSDRIQAYVLSRERDHLPQGWSVRHLTDNGLKFSESLDTMNLRLCAHVMSLFAVRKARVTSTLAFMLGFSAILMGLR